MPVADGLKNLAQAIGMPWKAKKQLYGVLSGPVVCFFHYFVVTDHRYKVLICYSGGTFIMHISCRSAGQSLTYT